MFEEMDGKNERRDTKHPYKSALTCYTNDLIYIDVFTLCTITKTQTIKILFEFCSSFTSEYL